LPTSTEPTRGVQLKEGTFTFSQHFKCNVDVKALKEIPQKLDICQQGIEGLNDLFYEVAPDQKESVLIQKAIWENVLERILDMRVFNATSSYTNVSNQLNPLKVILPENRQYFPIDSAFSKEPNNIFCETKRFARELLDIVVAIKTMREDNLFGFPEFHIYPTRDAFVLTDTDTGERHIAIGIYSILPAEEDENLNTEQYSIKAIRDLISQRWDKREFRQVYKADSLDKMIMHLRKLAPDLPTWKKFTLGTCKIFSYAALTFIVFSALMILNGLCPWNKAILEDINIYEISNDGIRALAPETTIVDGYKQDVNSRIRILLQSAKRSDKTYQVVGTYRSPMRLDTMGGLLIFNLLNVSTKLDRLYHLNYSEAIKHSDLNFNPELKLVTIVPVDEISLFRLEGRKNVWGRDRIQLTASKNINKVQNKSAREAVAPAEKDAKVPALDLELFVMKPQWTLEMNPKEIAFQQAEAGKESIETDLINIYANPTDAEKDKGVKIAEANLDSYFTVSFNRAGVPIQIHYLDPKGDALAKVIFDSFDEGKLKTAPKLQSVRVDTRKNRDRDEEEEEEAEIEEEDQDYDRGKSRNSAKRLPALKNIDTFWLKRNDAVAQLAQQQGDITKEQLVECLRVWRTTPSLDMQQLLIEKGFLTKAKCDDIVKKLSKSSPEALGIKVEVIKDLYYRLPAIPKDVNALKMVVLSRHLPSEEIKGNLHIAIPGIEKTISVPITFQPKQEVEFDPGQIADIRETVTGVALPIKVNKRVWGELKSYQPHEFRYFMFQLEEKADAAHLEGYPSFTVGLQLRDDPDKLYFYNPVTKETGTISDYQRRAGKIYFSAKAETYGKASSNFFEVDAKNPYLFGIRENIAKTTSNLYIMILTDKNVEESQLTLRWRSGEEAAKLPTTARSKEGLRLVHWKSDSPIKEISRYTPKDWLEEKIALRGPLGNAQFQAIIFSGEQADKDVSSDVYVNIADPKLVNILYQTVDGDWFANIDASHKNVKALVEHPSQLGKKKFGKEREQLEYFRAETKEIGRIEKFLFVPGEGVLPGQEPKTTKVTFYYPEKDMYVALDVEVSCEEALKVDSKLALDGIGNTEEKQTPAELKLTFSNYPRAKANELENDLMFLATCASTALLHAQYHSELTANSEDMRWAEAIRWSLESIGLNGPANPPSSMGQLGDTIKVAIEAKNEDGLKKSYEIMRETLLLAWSPQAQDLLSYHLGWKEIGKALREGKSFQNDNFALNIKLQPERVLPPLVNEPERFETVEFIIPCDKLVLDKVKTNVVELRESYYYNIPKNFASASSIQNVLKSIYPFEEAFPEQDKTMDSGVEVSTTYYENILKYSLWEHRLNDFRKQESKFYVAMLGVTSEIADLAGGIDEQEVNKVANEMQKQLSNYFISPLEISRVYWSEIKNKVRGNAEENRGKIGSEEQQSLLRYIERSMMSQLTDTTCWYTNFSFLIDRYTLDACPYHKDIYIKTYRPTTEGYPGESIKFRIFKRDGMQISPYPGQEYSVDVLNYGYDTHLITVKGMTVYQDWFTEHPCNEIKPTNADKRLRIKLYYEEQGEEKELVRPGVGAPPIIDFDVHPASVILFELKGYHISPDRIRQIVRSKDFSIVTTKGNTKWNWTFSFDNGPIVVPFSYKIKKSLRDLVSYSTHILSWKQDPAAPEDERKLESLASKYDMEFLYINTQEQLPMSQFFPYTKMEDICRDYDNGRMSSNRMIDFLEKLFSSSEQIKGTIKFKWNPELTAYYKNNHDKDQMFRYAYQNSHELRVTVPAIFETPADFTGTHPALVCPPGSQMSVIWRIVPSKNTLQRGFPKYILEKKLFPSSDPVVSKE
jgi:hypothetical protein